MALYHDLADVLREQIVAGGLPPGSPLPSANKLAYEHNTGRDTVLKALKLLRGEGLLFMAPDRSIRVGPARPRPVGDTGQPVLDVVDVPPGAMLRARMPTPKERDALGMPEGVPVLVVRIGEDEEVHSAEGLAMRMS